MKFQVLILFILIVISDDVISYPSTIGLGYKNCITCHYNPYGQGALNDYGRALSATVISDRLFVPNSITDEQLGNASGALFSSPRQNWFRPSYDLRRVYYQQNIGKENEAHSNFVMQNDLAIVLQKNIGQSLLFFSASYTMLPSDNFYDGEKAKNYSKEHYIGYRPNNNFGIYIGKMDKVFGIRVPDHFAYSRQNNRLGHSDQVHSTLLHMSGDSFEIGLQHIVGDREKEPDEHSQGYSVKLEKDLNKNIRLGLSVLEEKYQQQNLEYYIQSFFMKAKVGHGSALLAEIGKKTTTTNSTKTDSEYIFIQNYLNLFRGFYYITTLEQYIPDLNKTAKQLRISPGIQYFPVQRVEFRFDLFNTRQLDSEQAPEDNWRLLGQLHLWL